MYPRQSPTTHTEQLGAEASVYDWARAQVHALNPTAACVWRQCDGATSIDAIAAALRVEMSIPEAEVVVDLTLKQLARVHLLELPVAPRGDRPATTRRWLLSRGVAAAMLPAIYSIVAPSPVDAQSLPAAAPTLTSLSPNQGPLGATVAVTLTGANFVIGATTVTVNSGGVTATNVTVSSATTLTANIVIEATATPGAHTVTVTTARGTSAPQTFTVGAAAPTPAPTLTSVTPNQGVPSSTVPVTLTGTNFVVAATTVAVSGAGVTVNNIVVGSATSLTANIVIDPAAATGARTVTVTTAGGTSGGQTFTINPPAPSAPTLTSVAPNQGLQGATVAVTLTGTNFVVAATSVAVSGVGVTVNNVIVGGTTSLTANFAIDPAAAVGARTVTVTTAGGTSGPQTFTINLPPAPTLTSVAPNQGLQGATVAVTLTGTNFIAGATVAVSGTGVTVNTTVVASSTSLTANFVLDPTAAAGARTVTVTTAGGTSGGQTFTIILPAPLPTLTSISPNRGDRGSIVPVTLTGTNFVVGATTVAVGGASGVTVTNVVVGSSTSLTATFVLAATAGFGPRIVTVTTAGGTSGAQTFTIGGSVTFNFSGNPVPFAVPDAVVSVTIQATGAKGADGAGVGGDSGGDGGRATATVFVTPSATLTVRVGGIGILTAGGFNGGGASSGIGGGGGGGASSVHDGATPLVIAGGGAGGGAGAGSTATFAGRGGGCNGLSGDPGESTSGGGGGGGGNQSNGGAGGDTNSAIGTDGTAGVAGQGGNGGSAAAGVVGGGGGGGGYFGGGGGGGGETGVFGAAGGGGGSSFTAPGATDVVHEGRVGFGSGLVTITW